MERSQKEALEVELRLAREVQSSLLPIESPRVAGYDIAGRTIPAKTVGGDFFDFIPTSEGRLALAVADVSGKGLPASLLMANLQATLRSQILLNPPPHECLARANRLLFHSTSPEKFATLFYAILDTRRHTLDFCNAGHTPPLLFYDHAPPRRLETGGLILGIVEDVSYVHDHVGMQPGNVLVVCSDGVTEAINADGEFFGEDRLIDLIRQEQHLGAERLLEAIIASVDSFAGGTQHIDDITLMIVKRTS